MALKIASRPVPGRHDHGQDRGAREDIAPGEPSDRISRPVQQGRRRAQRLLATSRGSISTACSRTATRTRSSMPRTSGRSAVRSFWASTRDVTRSPTRSTKMGLRVQGDALNQAFSASRSSPTGRSRSQKPTSRRSSRRSSAPIWSAGYHLQELEVAGGTVGVPRARVVLVAELRREARGEPDGDGMIDAACAAIRQATGVDATSSGFNVSSVTGGIDALGDVVVQLESERPRVSGRGVSTDVVEASARAYTAAVSRLERVRATQRRAEDRARPLR